METKICSKCKTEKSIDFFCVDKSRKDGHSYICKSCHQNKNNLTKDNRKEYYDINKSLISESKKEYYKNNKDLLSKKAKLYREENPEYFTLYSRDYVKKRKLTDPLFKLKFNISDLIRKHFKLKGVTKKSKSSIILGCSIEELKIYLESKFEPWMTWDNYGNWNGIPKEINQSWDLDHIIPLKTATTEEDVIKLNHYTNLQPLCSYVNRYIKKDKL